MLKALPILYVIPASAGPSAAATPLVVSLQKHIKKLDHPNAEVTVRSTLLTHTPALSTIKGMKRSCSPKEPMPMDLIPEAFGPGSHKGNLLMQTYVYFRSPRFQLPQRQPGGFFYQNSLLKKTEQHLTNCTGGPNK